VLRQWQGLSFADTGQKLGIAEDAARMRFQRALARLAQVVKRIQQGHLGQVLAEQEQGGQRP
jgi:DNA-directed RNA polymerase specialized sigma24 family protein